MTESRLLVVDLELTCWRDAPPAGEAPEIIEIGLVELDSRQRSITREARFLVRPVSSKLSAFATELTGITAAELTREARPFREVARSIRKAFGAKPWLAWGRDNEAIGAAALMAGADHPFPGPFANLAELYRLLTGAACKVALEDALAAHGVTPDLPAHSALVDARNTARLFLALGRRLDL